MTSPLLRRQHAPDASGLIHHVTPENAGWGHVGFSNYKLAPGQKVSDLSGTEECCIVILTGTARIVAGAGDFGILGERPTVFEGLPWSVYCPPHQRWSVTAETACEIALCRAPAKGGLPPRLIPPTDVGLETRGTAQNIRHVRNIMPEQVPHAENLLVVEVITPGGNWSSYPSHKHDQDDLPHESYLEEVYYHRLSRPGFAFQRVYTDDRSLDETMTVHDGDCVLVPKGYHPVGAPYGFDLDYLNVMAGPHRTWKFRFDPDVRFLLG
jgi:5-deoxy-glucuronate isomerase